MQKCVSDFLDEVCGHVRSRRWQTSIRSELASHLADRVDELGARGLTEEDAAMEAVAVMGSPKEIGVRLAKAHKPDISGVVAGFAMISAVFFFNLLLLSNYNIGASVVYIDFPSAVFVLGLSAGFVLIGGIRDISLEQLLKRVTRGAIYAGAIGSITAIMMCFSNLSDVSTVGLNMSLSLITMLYGVLLSGIANALIPLARNDGERREIIRGKLNLQ